MTNNPLIAKWEELHNPKKEEPKKEIGFELPEGFIEQAENLNPPYQKLTTYDPDDLKVSFQQVADKIQQGKAQVANMSMEIDSMSIMRNKIIFEIYVDD
jgi:uncharacterized protein YcnI